MKLLADWPQLSALVVLTLTFALIACESDADRIRQTNEAEQARTFTPISTPTILSAEITTVEIQDGDCINSTIEEGITIETVVIVPCSSSWQYRVLESFAVTGFDSYPGEDSFARMAYEQCDRRFTDFLYPLFESWTLGSQRTVTCLQQSFGLSTSDRSKLDRLVGSLGLDAGECFNDAPETDGLLVELVDCSGSWQYRMLNSFTVTGFGSYPGEDSFARMAYERCDRRHTDFLHPLWESWILGEKTVTCIQQSFGISTSDPAKLDRLVDVYSLNTGECFNEAPETDSLLIELVDCSDSWQYSVLNSFTVIGFDNYPGEDSFVRMAYERCDRRHADFLYPLRESWALGDKTVTCLQQSFGLSTSDPAKLDRLVTIDSLNVGECFNDAPETDYLLVEFVSCSGDWEEQIVSIFAVSRDGSFPGEAYFQDQAEEHCRTPWDYYYSPNAETWQIGDRDVICVRTP